MTFDLAFLRKRILKVCQHETCCAMGAKDTIKNAYKVAKELEDNPDKKCEVIPIACLGGCGFGPNVWYKGQVYNQVHTEEDIKKIIDDDGQNRTSVPSPSFEGLPSLRE